MMSDNYKFKFSSKKGQVGETITWVIATIIIVIVLVFFIFGASMMGSTKVLGKFKDSLFSKSYSLDEDVFLKKSIYTYSMIDSVDVRKVLDKNLVKMAEGNNFSLEYEEVKKQILGRLK